MSVSDDDREPIYRMHVATLRNRCRHADKTAQSLVVRWIPAGDINRQMVTLRCDRCGEWLALGEATETPEVLVEIRAAEIAAGVIMHSESHWQLTNATHREWFGWMAHASMPQTFGVSLSSTQQAGYLARVIAHTEERS